MEKLLVENSEGNLALEKFDLNQASLHYTNALQHAQNLLDRRWQGGLHGSLGTLAILQGQRQIAREHLEIAVQVASEMGDRQWAGNAHCNLGLLLFELNEHSAAGIQLEAALRIARDIGHRRLEATTLCNLGLVKWSQNALDSALKDFVQAVELAKVIHAPRMEGQFRGYLGELLGELGNGMEAIACFGVAESLLESGSNGSSMALLQCQRAACSCHLGDLAAAKWHLSRAETIASKMTQAADSELVNALKRARQTISLHCY